MFKYRHIISFFTTTLFYLLLVGTYIYLQTKYLVADEEPKEQVINLNLATFVPEILPLIEEPKEEEVVEEIIEKPVVEEEPEPIVEELKVEEIVPEPIVEKVTPIPVVKKVVKKKIKKKPKKKVKKKVKKRVKKKVKKRTKVRRAKKPTKARAGSRKKSSKAQKSRFLSNIRAKINKNKSYPKIAKRRGMQGSVKVRFTILRSGKVGSISVSGPKVFHTSAKSAVKRAFPINTKNVPISLPQSVNLTLRYQLR